MYSEYTESGSITCSGTWLVSEDFTSHTEQHFRIARISPSGDSQIIVLRDWSQDFHSKGTWGGFSPIHTELTQTAPVPDLPATDFSLIGDRNGGILVSWQTKHPPYCALSIYNRDPYFSQQDGCVPDFTQERRLLTVSGKGIETDVAQAYPGQSGPFKPVVQNAEGISYGTVNTGGAFPSLIAFDSSADVKWLEATNAVITPLYALADGGLTYREGTSQLVTVDSVGQEVHRSNDNQTVLSWFGENYSGISVPSSLSSLASLPRPMLAGTWAAIWGGNHSNTGTAVQQEWFPQLVSCLAPSRECQDHGWSSATGGPREWIYNGLKALKVLLGTPCVQNSQNNLVKQACNLDTYVFTSSLKDANGQQASRSAFLAFLDKDTFPSFYDGTVSTLPHSGWVSEFSDSLKVSNDFADPGVTAETIIFDARVRPDIPKMRAFFRPGAIYRQFLNVDGPYNSNNIALVFHEALHAFTRLPDFPNFLLNPSRPNLKKVIGCNLNWSGTYDITAFLMQFTDPVAPPMVEPCTEYSGRIPPQVPPQ